MTEAGQTDALEVCYTQYLFCRTAQEKFHNVYILIYHGNTSYVKKKRHRNVKILPETGQWENMNNVTHTVVQKAVVSGTCLLQVSNFYHLLNTITKAEYTKHEETYLVRHTHLSNFSLQNSLLHL